MQSDLGNREIMARNILFYMKKYGKGRKEICRDLNIKYTTFTDWVKGKNYPRIEKIEALADYFHVSKADLVEDRSNRGEQQPVLSNNLYASLPLLDQILAKEDLINPAQSIAYTRIPADVSPEEDYFALRIHGNQMSPLIQDKDIVIVHRRTDIPSGSIVIALYDRKLLCRRFLREEGGVTLFSYSPEEKLYHFTAAKMKANVVELLGQVVEIRRPLPVPAGEP